MQLRFSLHSPPKSGTVKTTPCTLEQGRLNLTNAQGQPYGVWSHGKNKGLTRIDYWRYNVADLLGGHWYSTPSTGLCDSKHALACTWRVAEVVKKVSRACHDQSMFASVTRYAAYVSKSSGKPDCFDQCPGGAKNTSSPCWIECYYNTMLGPHSSTGFGTATSPFLRGHMPIEALETAWLAPFVSSDPKKGGCPDIQASRVNR